MDVIITPDNETLSSHIMADSLHPEKEYDIVRDYFTIEEWRGIDELIRNQLMIESSMPEPRDHLLNMINEMHNKIKVLFPYGIDENPDYNRPAQIGQELEDFDGRIK